MFLSEISICKNRTSEAKTIPDREVGLPSAISTRKQALLAEVMSRRQRQPCVKNLETETT